MGQDRGMSLGRTRISARLLHPVVGAVPLVTLLWLGAGCGSGEPVPAFPSDPTPDEHEVGGVFGLINVITSGTGAEVHAVFAEQLPSTGILDGLAWLGVGDLGNGYWIPPDVPDVLVEVSTLQSDLQWIEDRYYDVGPTITVVDVQAERVDETDDPDGFESIGLAYYRDDGTASVGQLGVLDSIGFVWPGGDDVEGVARPGALERADVLEMTSHDPLETLSWFEGDDVELTWNEGEIGQVLITLLGDDRWYQAAISAGTQFTLPGEILDEAVTDRFEVRVSRTVAPMVEAGPGHVVYRHTAEQRLVFERIGVMTVEPSSVFLDTSTLLQVTHHDGVFVEGETLFDLGEGVAVDSMRVIDGEGPLAELEISVSPDAAPGEHDLRASTGEETVVAARVLDVLLPPTDTCEVAFELPNQGVYYGDLTGLTDDYSDPSACTGYPAEGPDAVYRLQVPDDRLLSATLYYENGDAVLYLVDACDAMEEPVACSDIGGLNTAEFVTHAPAPGEGGEYYLVVDSFGALPVEAEYGYSLSVHLYNY